LVRFPGTHPHQKKGGRKRERRPQEKKKETQNLLKTIGRGEKGPVIARRFFGKKKNLSRYRGVFLHHWSAGRKTERRKKKGGKKSAVDDV